MRQPDNRVESFPPNWHFTSAVSGNCFQSRYGFINSVRGEDPVVVPGQYGQIGRRYLQQLADRSFTFSICTMTARARRLKFRLTHVEVLGLSGTSQPGSKAGNHQPLQAITNHVMPPRVFGGFVAFLNLAQLTQVNMTGCFGSRVIPIMSTASSAPGAAATRHRRPRCRRLWDIDPSEALARADAKQFSSPVIFFPSAGTVDRCRQAGSAKSGFAAPAFQTSAPAAPVRRAIRAPGFSGANWPRQAICWSGRTSTSFSA